MAKSRRDVVVAFITMWQPVWILTDEWPVVALGNWAPDEQFSPVTVMGHEKWKLTIAVRQHANGRAIVYGEYDYRSRDGEREIKKEHVHAGTMCVGIDEIPAAIASVGSRLGDKIGALGDAGLHAKASRKIQSVADEATETLPAEDLTQTPFSPKM